MKYTISLLFFFCISVFSQTNDTTYIHSDSLKIKNIHNINEWDFQSGDDSLWANPSFSSVGWGVLDSRLNDDSLNNGTWTGIGWFRKTIVIDSALTNSTIVFTLNHYGASELYVNGELINKFGRVSNNYDDEEVYYSNSRPIILNLDSSLVYQISIRYSNNIPIKYPYLFKKYTSRFGFNLTAKNLKKGLDLYGNSDQQTIFAALGGIFISISIIYLLLFLFYSSLKEYFYYTIFAFSIGVTLSEVAFRNIINSSLNYYLIWGIVDYLIPIFALLSVLAFIYTIFYGRLLKLFYILCFMGFISYLLHLLEIIGSSLFFVLALISSIEILRVIIVALKNKKNNSWVMGIGLGVFASAILTILVFTLIDDGKIDSVLFFIVFLFSIPLSMSVYLARSSSQTNTNLEIQLDNVKKLSEEAIEQEKMAAKLEIESQLVKQENERKTKELEEARQLQLSMLPKELPKIDNLDIAVYMQTATEVGGDYYDFQVGDDGTLNVAIGDATGHGMQAGTIVTITKSLFHSLASEKDILSSFSEISRVIKGMNFRQLSMCLILMEIKDDTLSISSAAMPPALIFRNKNKFVEELSFQGMPLGAMKNFPYQLKETNLDSGDTIFLFSDGLPELMNDKKEMYGYERTKAELKSVAEKTSDEIVNHFKNSASNWANGNDPDDDVTFVVVKVK